jgi:O-antigen/teichoic acid export membrane protein
MKLNSISMPARVDELIAHLRTPLYRNGYALMISTGATSLLGLLYWTIAARRYQTDNVGLNSMAISTLIFLSGVAQVNLQEGMIRFLPRAGTRTLRLVVYTYGTAIVLSLIVGVIFCLGIPLWTPALTFLTDSSSGMLWFVAAVILWNIFVVEDSILIGLRQAVYIPIENAIFSLIKIAFLLLLAGALPQTGIFLSWTVSVILIIIPINWLIFRRLIPKHVETVGSEAAAPMLGEMAKYVAGNYVAALLSSLSSAILPVIIIQVAGAEANAHFYLAWVIASSLQIIAANMSTSLTVEATFAAGNHEQYQRRALIGIARIVLPLAVVLILGAPLILRIVGEGYAEESTLLLQLLALSAIPNLFNMVYVGIARAQNRLKSIVAVYGANAVLVLAFSALFMPSFGITGVGLAWVISQTSIAVVIFALSKLNTRRLATQVMEVSN